MWIKENHRLGTAGAHRAGLVLGARHPGHLMACAQCERHRRSTPASELLLKSRICCHANAQNRAPVADQPNQRVSAGSAAEREGRRLWRSPSPPRGAGLRSVQPPDAFTAQGAARRDANLNRDRARLMALWTGRRHFSRSGLHAPSAEKTQPSPLGHGPRLCPLGQHTGYQQPFDLLQPQARFARTMIDFDPCRAQ